MEPKSIYIANRRPDLTRGIFVERWKQHGELAASLPFWDNVSRYAQCDAISVAGLDNTCDGVGLVWYRSMEAREAVGRTPELQRLLAEDELRFFSCYVRDFAMLTEEQVVRPGAVGGWKLFLLDEATDPPLDLAGEPGAGRVTVSRRIAPHLTPLSRLAYNSVLECWFADRAALEAAVQVHRASLTAPGRAATAAVERPIYGLG